MNNTKNNNIEENKNIPIQLNLWKDDFIVPNKTQSFQDIVKEYFNEAIKEIKNEINYTFLPKSKKIKLKLKNTHNYYLEMLNISDNFYDKNILNINESEIENNLTNFLKNKLNIIKNENSYNISFESNFLHDSSKAEYIQKIILPEISQLLTASLLVTSYIDNELNTNPLNKILNKFGKLHNMSSEVVYLTLKESPQLLNKYKDNEKLLDNKNLIIDNVSINEAIVKANFFVLKTTIDIIKDLKDNISNLNISQNEKEKIINYIDNKTVYKEGKFDLFSFKEIAGNVDKLLANEDFKKNIQSKKVSP